MERLTYKNYIEEYEVNFEKSSDKNWSIAESDTHIKVTGEPIKKLGELEDILESWHIENLEELKTRLNDCQVYHLQNNSNETLIHNLKNELAELKQTQNQKAIEELEKLKSAILSERNTTYFKFDNFNKGKDTAYYWANEIIDNQIKSLRGEE